MKGFPALIRTARSFNDQFTFCVFLQAPEESGFFFGPFFFGLSNRTFSLLPTGSSSLCEPIMIYGNNKTVGSDK